MVLAFLFPSGSHPQKRNVDTITVNLFTVLTYPAVAAAHLIAQTWAYNQSLQELSPNLSAQRLASIKASLIITGTFMPIDVVLFLVAVSFKCVKRAFLLAMIGSFCFAAECYLYFSHAVSQHMERDLNRPFLINYTSLLIIIMTVLIFCPILGFAAIVKFFIGSLTPSQAQRSDRDAEGMKIKTERPSFKDSRSSRFITALSLLFLPLYMIGSMLPFLSGVFSNLPSQLLPWLRGACSNIAHGLIPRSNTSVRELDQVVALLTGATVLGFSLYSTAVAYYQAWLKRARVQRQEREIELRRVRNRDHPSRTLEVE